MRIFNVGWIVFLLIITIIGFSTYSYNMQKEADIKGLIVIILFVGVGYIGAVIGNALRIYAMPDIYYTDGTLWGNIKTRFFWEHGPQLSGFFIIYFVIIFLLIPYFDTSS